MREPPEWFKVYPPPHRSHPRIGLEMPSAMPAPRAERIARTAASQPSPSAFPKDEVAPGAAPQARKAAAGSCQQAASSRQPPPAGSRPGRTAGSHSRPPPLQPPPSRAAVHVQAAWRGRQARQQHADRTSHFGGGVGGGRAVLVQRRWTVKLSAGAGRPPPTLCRICVRCPCRCRCRCCGCCRWRFPAAALPLPLPLPLLLPRPRPRSGPRTIISPGHRLRAPNPHSHTCASPLPTPGTPFVYCMQCA